MGTKVQQSSGRLVELTTTEFFHLVQQVDTTQLFIGTGESGSYRYTIDYLGFTFFAESVHQLPLPINLQLAPLANELLFVGRMGAEVMPPLFA